MKKRIFMCGIGVQQAHIAWVAGIRPDERFRVNDDTGKVLIVKRVAR